MPAAPSFSHDPVEFSSPQGWIRVAEPAPGVFHSVVRGRATAGVVGVIMRFGEEMIASGRRLLVFHDWYAVDGYDGEARRKLTEWTARIVPYWDASHILFGSPLIAMAIAVASLTTRGKITTYSSRKNWEEALASACAARGSPMGGT